MGFLSLTSVRLIGPFHRSTSKLVKGVGWKAGMVGEAPESVKKRIPGLVGLPWKKNEIGVVRITSFGTSI